LQGRRTTSSADIGASLSNTCSPQHGGEASVSVAAVTKVIRRPAGGSE
jgi:hypothetical protein